MANREHPPRRTARSIAKGTWKSWTMRFGGALVALPIFWPKIEPELVKLLPSLLGPESAAIAIQVIGVVVIILRFRTDKAIWDKGARQ